MSLSASGDRPVCLIATHLSLLHLDQKKYGIYRRLAMLAEAAAAAGAVLRIYCVAYQADQRECPTGIEQRIAAGIREHWHVDAEVVVGRSANASRAPWLLRQIAGTFGYGHTAFCRDLLDPASLGKLAQEVRARPAFIMAHRLPMMHFISQSVARDVPVFFDLDDLEHVAVARSMSQLGSGRAKLFAALSIPGLLWAQLRGARRANRTFVCSTIDAERARGLFHTDRIAVLPNAAAMPASASPEPSPRPVLLMVGIYSFGPNQDAANHFISAVWPLIRQARPDAEVWFAGGAPESVAHYRAEIPGVKFLGFVDDLGETYRQARVVICPIRYGSGTRVKLVEAAAWAKAIVSTHIGAEGLGMVAGQHVLYADSPDDFAKACLRLLDNPAQCEELGRNARALAQSTYDKQHIVRRLSEELQRATAGSSRVTPDVSQALP